MRSGETRGPQTALNSVREKPGRVLVRDDRAARPAHEGRHHLADVFEQSGSNDRLVGSLARADGDTNHGTREMA